jgi:uncharacterized damage-inducible protein DinB
VSHDRRTQVHEIDALVSALDTGEVLRQLAEMPARLEALCRDIDADRLERAPSPGEWSVNEVLAHLRVCADVWGGSIQAMLERDRPTLRYVSPRTFARKTDYAARPFARNLAEYRAQRDALAGTLGALAPGDWARGATFTGTVRGREQTVLSYVRRILAHELEHRQQIEATIPAL